ncbi:MAG: FAD-dependent thymidylate synthase [Treponema sp.]|jgi:thymidylate synthase (FAD)|nr:FAD-dependent thymidylate synthase [Treponema sp.]
MAHCVVPEAEAILDREFKVLDKGFVRLVDYLGGDARIVQAARVSYGEGTKSYREDAGLIDYLMRHEHTSPFEQVALSFHVKLPIFVARQWIRHRTARVNEISGRYSIMKDEFYLPADADVAAQSEDNKQGRAEEPMEAAEAAKIRNLLDKGQRAAYEDYSSLVEEGLARELARINLPLSLYTEWYWQIDLHNLFRFLSLRLDPHAQKEIRLYARTMLEITRAVAPAATESFERNILHGVRFNGAEMAELKRRLGVAGKGAPTEATAGMAKAGNAVPGKAPEQGQEPLLKGKALERFEEKLRSGKQI